LHDPSPVSARRPSHDHEETADVPDGQKAALAMEVSRVFALEHGIVEHGGGAHEVDAEFFQVAGATRLFPLEHTPLPTQQAAPPASDVAR
jgi:hypothetical protein